MAHVPRGMCSRRSTCAPPSVVCSTVTTPPQRPTSSHEHRRPAGARLSTPRAASRGPRGALCRAPCPSTGCDRHQREDARCRPPAPREARGCRVSVGRWREARGRGSSRKLRAASGRRGVNWGRTRRELRCCWRGHHGSTMATPRRSRVPAWPRLLLLPTAARLVLYRGAASRLASPLQSSRLVSSAKPPSTQRRCPESRSRPG